MKRLILLLATIVCLVSCNDKDALWTNSIVDIDSRVTYLEQLCSQMNTNIESMQVIIQALQERDYVTSIVEIKEGDKVIGYTITFAKNPAITIYKGNDGKDGKDGKDGETPVIGVAKDADNIYYWTLNGEWLVDGQGNKIKAVGKDGTNGTNGTNGKDGVSPKLKIESDYWYISYDNGSTWTQLTKAKGDKGDSMFKSVTYDENYVYLTLADGTLLTISFNNQGVKIVNGAIMAKFAVSPTKNVYFSQGNLQYNRYAGTHLCADGTTQEGIWRFADNQVYSIGTYNDTVDRPTAKRYLDRFAWGTSGWTSGAVTNQPWMNYNYDGYLTDFIIQEDWRNSLAGTCANADWGVYNAINNGGNQPNQWRTLTKDEWEYLLCERPNANKLKTYAKIDETFGTIILPDTIDSESLPFMFEQANFVQIFSDAQWRYLEERGAIYLPNPGKYWSTTAGIVESNKHVYYVHFENGVAACGKYSTARCELNYVRLVKDVE